MKLIENFSTIVNKWYALCLAKECFLCGKKYPEGIMIQMPRDSKTSFSRRFRGEYLFHVQDTHGFEPEIFIEMLREEIKRKR